MWRWASGSERNRPKPRSPNGARELQIFCPLSFQPPSTLVAVEHAARPGRCRTRLGPGLGPDLLAAGHFRQHPLELFLGAVREQCRRQHRGAVGAGPARAPARKYSSSNTTHCSRVASRPPYSLGHAITDSPASKSTLSQRRCCSKPSRVSYDFGREATPGWLPGSRGPRPGRPRSRRRNSGPLHPFSGPLLRSTGLITLPPGFRGSTSRNSTDRGTLKFARCSRVWAITAASSSATPGLSTT